MPLRDLEPWHEWLRRESPSAVARASPDRSSPRSATSHGAGAERPGRSPIGSAGLRTALRRAPRAAGEVSVEVWYRHFYATADVDVIAVTNQ